MFYKQVLRKSKFGKSIYSNVTRIDRIKSEKKPKF